MWVRKCEQSALFSRFEKRFARDVVLRANYFGPRKKKVIFFFPTSSYHLSSPRVLGGHYGLTPGGVFSLIINSRKQLIGEESLDALAMLQVSSQPYFTLLLCPWSSTLQVRQQVGVPKTNFQNE
jgi:hypothetical protein